jgi:hypothetical protein
VLPPPSWLVVPEQKERQVATEAPIGDDAAEEPGPADENADDADEDEDDEDAAKVSTAGTGDIIRSSR